jgi:hypothetical protein
MWQLLATLCVALSLALVALGGSNLLAAPPPSHRGDHWGYGSYILCWCNYRDVRGVGEACKLSLPGPLLCLRGPICFITDPVGFRAGGHPCTPLYPCAPSAILSSPPSLCLDKKEKRGRKGEREKEKGNRKKYQGLVGATLPSSLSHGRAGLDFFHCYAEPSAKTHDAWVYVGGRACGLSGAGGPRVPRAYERIHGVIYDILRAGIRHASAPVPPLAPAVLWPRASPPNSLESPTHRCLRHPV